MASVWYELAAIYDKQQRYPDAYNALVEAKKLLDQKSSSFRYDAVRIARNARLTTKTISAEHFEKWQVEGSKLPPLPHGLALLTSHPRSGTTLLEQVLDSHPQLTSADELQVFADIVYMPLGRGVDQGAAMPEVLGKSDLDHLTRLRRGYLSAMEGALREPIGQRVLLDKNPELTNLIPAVCRVFPELKLIFALRDPRDVVISCFMQRLPLNPVSVHYLTLEDTVKKYVATMKAWLKIRELLCNPWIEVRYEDSVADLTAVSRRVLEFLGLPWDDAVLRYHERAQQKHVHSPTYESVTKPVYRSSVGRWRNYAEQLAPHMRRLEPYIEAFGYSEG